MHRQALILLVLLALGTPLAAAELRGHGGPVRALAVSADGAALTGSFDTRAVLWSLADGTARQVLRHHSASVNAVAFLPGGRLATAGQAGEIVLWTADGAPLRVLAAHGGPIAALSPSPDGTRLASAAWDATVRITPLDGGAPVTLEGHEGNVNAVLWLNEHRLVSAGYDGTLRFWSDTGRLEATQALAAPLNALARDAEARIWVAAADGVLRAFDADGAALAEVPLGTVPLVSLAVAADGRRLAAGDIDGSVAVLDADGAVTTRVETGAPAWALAFDPNGTQILAAGVDNAVRSWDARSGAPLAPPPQSVAGADLDSSRGAQVFRACVACHTLDPDDGQRAGPSLHGIFGRRIASAPGYAYSPALERMRIVWTPQTVSELFEQGPSRYTPGTKMPEQRIGSAEDRAALIAFLERATR